MERGGLLHDQERVFLLSTTHGAENHGLAAAMATMRTYQEQDVIGQIYRQGERLAAGSTRLLPTGHRATISTWPDAPPT